MRPLPALIAMTLTIGGCSRSEWTQTSSVTSPDGGYVAVAEYKGAPASNSDHVRVRLISQSSGSPLAGIPIVSATKSGRPLLRWESGNQLIVEVCGASSYEVQALQYGEPTYDENGKRRTIRVGVFAVHSLRNGRQLCAGTLE